MVSEASHGGIPERHEEPLRCSAAACHSRPLTACSEVAPPGRRECRKGPGEAARSLARRRLALALRIEDVRSRARGEAFPSKVLSRTRTSSCCTAPDPGVARTASPHRTASPITECPMSSVTNAPRRPDLEPRRAPIGQQRIIGTHVLDAAVGHAVGRQGQSALHQYGVPRARPPSDRAALRSHLQPRRAQWAASTK